MYAHSSRERYPFLDPPLGRRRSAHPPHESWPWAFSDVAGRSIGGICAMPGRRKPTAGKGRSSRPPTRPFPIFTSDLLPQLRLPISPSPFRISLSLWRPPASSRPPTHPATKMMTRRGSPATVIKKSAKAGPKATKVHPKNTAAPMAGQLGAGWRPGQEGWMGGARQLRSRLGVATRPREGRGAMSPPDPREGEGGHRNPWYRSARLPLRKPRR